MNKTRTLSLKRESISELTNGDLANVVGGALSFADTGCTTDTLKDSYRICSFNCPWTFNTCEA